MGYFNAAFVSKPSHYIKKSDQDILQKFTFCVT